MATFWEEKIPCWDMRECSKYICLGCPAYLHPEKPCWEIEGTLCDQILGTQKSCALCKVYFLYHNKATPSPNP
jgi:hypothetical protein